MLTHPEAAADAFYAMVPSGAWSYPFIALAMIATVIASQALITGTFSLVHQSIQLGYFPRLTVEHTSHEERGQIYVPLLNGFLATSCVVLVLVFRASSRLAAAYGLAVSATMAATSLAFYAVARVHFRWSRLAAGAVVAAFLVTDLGFLGANLLKFFDGGYVPALVGLAFTLVMIVWARGRSLLNHQLRRQSEPMEPFLATLPSRIDGRLPGIGVVMTATAHFAPPVLTRLVARFRRVYETTLLTTVMTEEVPHVPPGEQISLEPLGAGMHRLRIRFGFMDQPNVHQALVAALPRIAPVAPDALTYVLGIERLTAGAGGQMGGPAEGLFALLERNARNPSEYFGLPPAQVVELGARLDL
jgi:KUP system potassium uptake protein